MNIWDSLGKSTEIVEIVEYRQEWATAFEYEARRILDACGKYLVTVEHIGSTAVPGLAAKPCLDIMPGLALHEDGKKIVKPMIDLGYEFRGEHGIPGRWYFVLFHKERVVVHAHTFTVGDENWIRHLFFRDYLRSHPEAVRQYAELKKKLAEKYRNDKHAYTQAKSQFIRPIEAVINKVN